MAQRAAADETAGTVSRGNGAVAPARRWLTRKRLFVLHGWLGMHFGLLLLLVCLSGAIAALAHEIEWLADPALRIDPQGPVRWQATYEALQRAYPGYAAGGFARSEASVMDGLAWASYVTLPDGRWAQVRVDPYRGRVVRPATRLYLTDYLRQLHYNFHSSWGFYLVSFVSFPLLLSVTSALLFYKGWWKRKGFFRLRSGKGPRAVWSGLHRLLGAWTLIFAVVVAVTGIWYLAENDLVPSEIAYPAPPSVAPEKMAAHGPVPAMPPLEAFVAAAREAFPELIPNGIYLPGAPGGTVTVQGQAGRPLMRDRANAVFLDPFDASVVAVRRSGESGALGWWVNAADALHFGYWGGLASKVLWALLGLCLPVLILSGAYLSLCRAGVAGGSAVHRQALSTRPWWLRYPLRTWALAPLLIALAWSCAEGYARRSDVSITAAVAVDETRLGPWRITLAREAASRGAAAPAATVYRLELRAEEGRVANIRRARLRVRLPNAGARAGSASGPEPSGGPGAVLTAELEPVWPRWTARLALPVAPGEAPPITVEAEDWGANRHTATLLDAPAGDSIPAPAPHRGPPAPAAFWGTVWVYALAAMIIAVGWFLLDRRMPSEARERRAS